MSVNGLPSDPLAAVRDPAFAATLVLATYLTAEANAASEANDRPKNGAVMFVVNQLNKSLQLVKEWYQDCAAGVKELKAARDRMLVELCRHEFLNCEQILELAGVSPLFLDQPQGLLCILRRHALGSEGAVGPVWIGSSQDNIDEFSSKLKMLCRRWRNRS
jgi:hypothetical protein